jgi:hypothetical protein
MLHQRRYVPEEFPTVAVRMQDSGGGEPSHGVGSSLERRETDLGRSEI